MKDSTKGAPDKKARPKQQKSKVMQEWEHSQHQKAVLTEKLRALRMEKEATEKIAADAAQAAKPKKTAKKRAVKSKTA